jgi:predicted acyl esterase
MISRTGTGDLFLFAHDKGVSAMIIERDVAVPCDDGTVLRADVFGPTMARRNP